jgi:predicted transcriptional regulator
MTIKLRKIEVDAATADALEARAAARGIRVSELLAELVAPETAAGFSEAETIAELERRWRSVEAGGKTVPHEKVVRWLESWGTPAFRPRRDQ